MEEKIATFFAANTKGALQIHQFNELTSIFPNAHNAENVKMFRAFIDNKEMIQPIAEKLYARFLGREALTKEELMTLKQLIEQKLLRFVPQRPTKMIRQFLVERSDKSIIK